ncbi:MAG: hypothetical protein NTY37_06990 [Methanothrix sp.]|nr:hypothetical protein [Methanothrix sp.]
MAFLFLLKRLTETKMIKKTQKSVNLDGQTIWIADSAMYTADNIKELGADTSMRTQECGAESTGGVHGLGLIGRM